jgi:Uma2 family endonuclease
MIFPIDLAPEMTDILAMDPVEKEAIPLLSVEEYLRLEETAPEKHEYVSGRVFAMGGTSRDHNRITLNLATALHRHLSGGPCEAFMADVKVRIEAAGDDAFYYPDVVVGFDPEDRDPLYLTKPAVIFEILSRSTERIDRREKFFAYRQLASLEAYVLVAQHEERVEIYRRSKEWQAEIIQGDGLLALGSPLEFSIPMDVLYAGVER